MMGRKVGAVVLGVVVVAMVACSGHHRVSGLTGLQAVKTVDEDWGACLKLVYVPVNHASGAEADNAGRPGVLIKLARHANFFVTDPGTAGSQATPADQNTTKLLRQAEAIQPDCVGKRSGTLPPNFAGSSP
jgi:hypothetical protein